MEIKLRAVEPSDLDLLYRIENDPAVSSVTLGEAAVSRQMLWEYINNYTADIYRDRQLRLMIEANGKAVGAIDIADFDPKNLRAFVGIALEEGFRGYGIGREAMAIALQYARELGMHQLCAIVAKDNAASLKLFGALGFKTSGCLRSWLRHGNAYTDAVILQHML